MADTPPRRREQGMLDERALLEASLDEHREIVVRKIADLSDAAARRRLVPSATTAGGLVKHLRLHLDILREQLDGATGDG